MTEHTHRTLIDVRPGMPEWEKSFSKAAKAREATKWSRIRAANDWARSKQFSNMRGGFWAGYRQRLVEAGASPGLVESYIEELKDDRAFDLAWDARHKHG